MMVVSPFAMAEPTQPEQPADQSQQQTPADPGSGSQDQSSSQNSGSQSSDQQGSGSQSSSGQQSSGSQSSGSQGSSGSGGSQNNNSSNDSNNNSNNNINSNVYQQSGNNITEKKEKPKQSKKTVSLIYTSDMHSHLDSANSMGGSARLMSKIKTIKEKYPMSFVVDAGDFSMGTSFQSIFTTDAAEMKMMGELGYDVTTLGDHEFDYGIKGLGKMIGKAAGAKKIDRTYKTVKSPYTGKSYTQIESDQFMPQMVCSNIDWDATFADKEIAKDGRFLKRQMNRYGVSDYTVIEKNGVRIAFFGMLDENAQGQIIERCVKWENNEERARQIVNEIKRNKEADLIVCLSNSSFMSTARSQSADEELANEVPDIDVIISAHEGPGYKEAMEVGNTLVVSAGSDTGSVGNLVLRKKSGRYELKNNKLYELDKKVAEDETIKYKVDDYISLVNSHYFSKYGMSYDQELASSKYGFESLDEFKVDRNDNALGNLIADSFVYSVKRAEGNNYEKVDAAIVPNAEVRSTFSKGSITTSDVFNVLSLGYGPDEKSGYPLVSAYITGKEMQRVAEIDASMSSRNEDVILHTAGLKYNFNDHRLFLNRATDIRLTDDGGGDREINNSKLYRVVAGLHTFDILAAVERRSKGLLAVIPKDKDGNEIKDISKNIVKRKGREIKEWYALASYLDSFDGNRIPSEYSGRDGRKNDETSLAPWSIIKQPNNYGVMLAAMIMIPIVILIGIIIHIRQRRRERRGYDDPMFGRKGAKKRRSRRKSRKSFAP